MVREINELIEKYKKNSSISKTDEKTYRRILFDLMNSNEYTTEIERILLEGPNEISMDELAKHLSSLVSEHAVDYLSKFSASKGVLENKGGAVGNRFVYLFSYLIDYINEQNEVLEQSFHLMVFYSYKNEKNEKNKRVVNSISSNLLPKVQKQGIMLDLKYIKDKKEWIMIRDLFMTCALESKNPKIIEKIYHWLKSSDNDMGNFTKEYLHAEVVKLSDVSSSIEIKNKKKEEEQAQKQAIKPMTGEKINNKTNKSKEHRSDLKTDIEPMYDKSVNHNEQEFEENTKSDEDSNHIYKGREFANEDDIKDFMIAISKKINNLENKTNIGNNHILVLKNELNDININISNFQNQFNKFQIIEQERESRIQELANNKRDLQIKNKELEERNEELLRHISVLGDKIEEQKEFTDTVKRNRKRQYDEQLNIIASKLSIEYKDFVDALEMEMTIELGENMREQLRTVFNILEKQGIKFN